MQEAKSRTVLDGICTTDHCLWVPNGSSVSPCKALSEFNLVAKGIFGPARMCNKNSHNLCARTCNEDIHELKLDNPHHGLERAAKHDVIRVVLDGKTENSLQRHRPGLKERLLDEFEST